MPNGATPGGFGGTFELEEEIVQSDFVSPEPSGIGTMGTLKPIHYANWNDDQHSWQQGYYKWTPGSPDQEYAEIDTWAYLNSESSGYDTRYVYEQPTGEWTTVEGASEISPTYRGPGGEAEEAKFGGMLDWLIPDQLKQDIKSKFAGPVDFGKGLYGKFYDEKDVGGDDFNQADWERRVEEAGFSDFIVPGTGNLEEVKNLSTEDEEMMEQMGIDLYNKSISDVDIFSEESIFGSLPGVGPDVQYGGGEAKRNILSGLVSGVTPLSMDKLRKLHTGYYAPYIEEQRDPLETQMASKRATARGAGGMFAGYGRRTGLEDIAEGSYLKKIEDIYSDVDKYRAESTKDILDIMTGWEDVVTGYTGE